MNKQSRRPAAFGIDDPIVVAERELDIDQPATHSETKNALLPVPAAIAALSSQAYIRWGTIFWSALGGLITMSFGLAVSQLVEDLFARSVALGWLGLLLALSAAIALLVIIIREIRGLIRLSTIEEIRYRATEAIKNDRREEGVAVARELMDLTRSSPALAHARRIVAQHLDDIIDGADMVRLSERNLLAPLDHEAKRLVSSAAKRVSIVTAISPRAFVDMAFVFVTTIGLIRQLAYLYGVRPGTLGIIRLARLCVTHLTVTGGLALGDSLVQQVLGHGIVAKLSSRLGEGVLNGLLTARLGLAAIDVVRPLPFTALPQPALGDVAAELLRQRPAN